jgi:hypothetical protein
VKNKICLEEMEQDLMEQDQLPAEVAAEDKVDRLEVVD